MNWNFKKKKFERLVETDVADNVVEANAGKDTGIDTSSPQPRSPRASGVSFDATPKVAEKEAPYYSLIPSKDTVPKTDPLRKTPGTAFWILGLELLMVGLFFIIAMFFWVLRLLYRSATMSPDPVPLLVGAAGALGFCFVGGLYLIIGTFKDRNESRPSNLKTLTVSLLPLVLYTLISKASPGYYVDALLHHGLIVLFALLWNAIGMFALFRARRLGLWAFCFLVFILPVVLAVVFLPGILTFIQYVHYLVPR